MDDEPFENGVWGNVYKAKLRKEDVVVKIIMTDGQRESEQILSEASIAFGLRHENVIKLFGVTGLNSSKLGIVMEQAEHGSLEKWIGMIESAKITGIALGIITGLEYVHSQRVIHRDIKPKNILMFGPKDDMIPKISDFGVAKLIQTNVVAMTRVGNSLYMAPEVEMFQSHSYWADVFSLAMTLFELFNEQLVSQSTDEVKRFIRQARIGSVGDVPQSCRVPQQLHNVIRRGWEQNPEDRPALAEYRSAVEGFKLFHMYLVLTVHVSHALRVQYIGSLLNWWSL